MNDQNSATPDPLHETAEALRRSASRMVQRPDQVTRARHLAQLAAATNTAVTPAAPGDAIHNITGLRTRTARALMAVAAAVVLIAVAAVALPNTGTEDLASGGDPGAAGTSSQGASDTTANEASEAVRTETAEEIAARAARTPSPVPLERTEDFVILTVAADKVEGVQAELARAAGSDPARIAIGDRSTSFAVPASVAARLSSTEGVTTVADTPVKNFNEPIEQTPVPSWGLDRIDALDIPLDNRYSYISAGAGVRVYVIDTGIRADHSDLSGRVGEGWSAVADSQGTNDCNGHGTHVAGTVAGRNYGVAKSATVVPVRVLDCSGSGYTSSVIAGINWVIANHPGGPAVINMSLGGPANASLDSAVADASAAGIIVVAAAGNSATDACSTSPARAPQALTIGATTASDARASYSNFGSCVDLFAPGSSITSAWIGSPSDTRTISGTSMAAPHVAGMVARLFQAQPGSSPSTITAALTGSATPDAISGTNGSVNLLANIVETPSEETPVDETPEEETPVDETPEEETPVDETPEEVAPPTTEPRSPGNSGREKTTPPGRQKKVAPPQAFTLSTVDQGVAAQWMDDPAATRYRLECALTVADAARHRPAFVLEVLPEEADLLPNRQLQLLLPAEALTNSRCWLISELGSDVSEPSNVELIPWSTGRPGNSGSAPGIIGTNPGNSGNAPGNSGNTPGNSGNTPGNSGNTPGNSGNAPGNSGNAPGKSPGNSAGNSAGNSSSGVAPSPVVPPTPPGPPAAPPGNSENSRGRANR